MFLIWPLQLWNIHCTKDSFSSIMVFCDDIYIMHPLYKKCEAPMFNSAWWKARTTLSEGHFFLSKQASIIPTYEQRFICSLGKKNHTSTHTLLILHWNQINILFLFQYSCKNFSNPFNSNFQIKMTELDSSQ